MLSSLRRFLMIAGIAAVAIAAIWLASHVALTVSDITDPTVRWIYLGVVAGLILIVFAAGFLIYRGPRTKKPRPGPERPSAAARIDRIFALEGFDRSKPREGYAAPKPGEFAEPEPGATGQLTVAVCGTGRVGKSALIAALHAALDTGAADQIVFRELPALGVDRTANADILRAVGAADVIVFVVDQDLRNFEYDAIWHAARSRRPIMVAVNKSDVFRAGELREVVGSIADKLADLVPHDLILPLSAAPKPLTRVSKLADGSEREELVARAPDVTALASRLTLAAEAAKA